eukprot:CAMPEP_0176357730 /NCGR_PEP_ID=MMETSP0126-20121128/15008_1 /TAXON_ID=141414 ORGANISM="Strombidinopsis acuminatum, Strain SPMC142" /NCGR_SAMPLE_ID=MMETSP0126 /ASSEMBLY_ACC=CAM_ASM_000229 /LENGTH=35 /DNA_ID= /DNA_START= /DNA_END= /DNA_ORIENTATION=
MAIAKECTSAFVKDEAGKCVPIPGLEDDHAYDEYW